MTLDAELRLLEPLRSLMLIQGFPTRSEFAAGRCEPGQIPDVRFQTEIIVAQQNVIDVSFPLALIAQQSWC